MQNLSVNELHVLTVRLEQGGELTGTDLAHVLSELSQCEVAEGGPYRYSDGTIDLGWNLMIHRFLIAIGVTLPKLEARLITSVRTEPPSSLALAPHELAIEIAHFERAHQGEQRMMGTKDVAYTNEEERVMIAVRAAMERRTDALSCELNEGIRFVVERTIRGNPDKQMSLMPLYLRQALGNAGSAFDDEYLGALGFANTCFWSSFIVYDDFWDEDEAAEARLLPIANIMARHYIRFFDELIPRESGFANFFHTAMDALDAANAWEVAHCRMHVSGSLITVPEVLPEYSDYGIKYHPAAGHVMGPVAMLMQLGHAVDSYEVAALVNFFRHYLVAMQLNDDAHDWREDLARGHISTAVAAILCTWKKRFPERSTIDLQADVPHLEKIFWFDVIEPLCNSILAQCTQSRETLSTLACIKNIAPLVQFITRNEDAAHAALYSQIQTKELLAALK